MLRSLNSGISGLKAFQTKLDVIGNNIANVNTVGFKKSQVVFEDLFSQTLKGANAPINSNGTVKLGGTNPIQVGLGTKVATVRNVFTPGGPMSTNLHTDLYVDGDGFFVVEDPAGKSFLTRAGNFSLDKDGNMINSNGMLVLDKNGDNIKVPSGCVSFTVAPDGVMQGMKSDGTLVPMMDTTNQPIKIGMVSVTNPSGLLKEGSSLYSLTENADNKTMLQLLSTGGNGQIVSGVLEMSNVDLSEEMTDMIVAQRGFQANSKIITVSDTIIEELINLKR
jgi:flagellar hook protein FlgE